MNNSKVEGIAFFCTDSGLITEVIHDGLGINSLSTKMEGKLFQNFIDEANRSKAFEFLVAIKTNSIAIDYQLNLSILNEIKTLYFMGLQVDNKILITGANTPRDSVEFTNDMQQISNEQANLIRSLIKNKSKQPAGSVDDSLYNEISKLNNELVNLQRELTRKNSELKKLNEIKNRFLGMAAHDLRSPLGVIQNYTDFILDEAGDTLNPDHKKFLGIVLNSTRFMISLIEDLLDYSKIEAGDVNLDLRSYNLAEQVEGIVELNQLIASRKMIHLKLQPVTEPIQVFADNNKIEQVLNNLITNAIKFSHPESEILISLSSENNFAYVSIRDSGIGIPSDKLSYIFTPFTKAGTTGTKGEKSTGLGLSIVKRIVEAQGGTIEVRSEEGKGSEFVFSIKLYKIA